MNKNAGIRDIALIPILVFIFGIIFFISFFVFNTALDRMIQTPQINQSEAATEALVGTKGITLHYDKIILAIFIGLTLAAVVSGYFIGGNKVFMVVYFIVIVITVITCAVLGNVWETISPMSVFGTTVSHFPITNHLLTYLPMYATIVGFISTLAMFIRPATGVEA